MTEPLQNEIDYHSILVVEDDLRLATLISDYLSNHGFSVDIENRGDAAVSRICTENPDLVILDLMLPGLSGFEICRAARPAYKGVIMMLTAQDEDIDQIVGLELGADDYVTKPVEPRVLLARVRSLLRRNVENTPQDATKSFPNGLNICAESRSVSIHGNDIQLTTNEFDLLWFLSSNAGRIISRDELYQALSGIDYDGVDRAMDIKISRLRKLLGDDSHEAKLIKTVRGKGYLFASGSHA